MKLWISNIITQLTRYVITYAYFPGVEFKLTLRLMSMKYTTGKYMENFESRMETLVFDILICKASITYLNTVLMCSVMGQICNLQCPKLKISNRIYSNLSFPDISLTISHNFQDIPHHIMNILIFCAQSIIRYWNYSKLSTGRRITILALKQMAERCRILPFVILAKIRFILQIKFT